MQGHAKVQHVIRGLFGPGQPGATACCMLGRLLSTNDSFMRGNCGCHVCCAGQQQGANAGLCLIEAVLPPAIATTAECTMLTHEPGSVHGMHFATSSNASL